MPAGSASLGGCVALLVAVLCAEELGSDERHENAHGDDERRDDTGSGGPQVPVDRQDPDPVDACEPDVAEKDEADDEDSEARADADGEEREKERQRDQQDPVIEGERNLWKAFECDAQPIESVREDSRAEQQAEAVVGLGVHVLGAKPDLPR